MSKLETLSLKEAAKFLGFKGTNRLCQKVRRGEIPGCKPGRDWRFLKVDLVQWMREQYHTHRKVTQVDMKGVNLCQSVKRKEVLTTIRASHSAELVNETWRPNWFIPIFNVWSHIMPTGVYKRSKDQIKKLIEMSKKPRKLRNGGYHAIRKWLYKNYGKANKCENEKCKKESYCFQWAKLKDKKLEHNIENFIQLCSQCHSFSCKGINKGNKHSAKKIIQCDLNGNFIKIWDCINDAAINFNISPSGITMCAREKLKKSGGFKWSYLTK